MSEQELQQIFTGHFHDGDVEITGDGKHFDVRIISEQFADLSMLKRQQMVYSLVSEHIKNGYLHALNIHALTTSEWDERNG